MRELFTRVISGLIYVLLLVIFIHYPITLIVVLSVFGVISLIEFSKLTGLTPLNQNILFLSLFLTLAVVNFIGVTHKVLNTIILFILIASIITNLMLIINVFTDNNRSILKVRDSISALCYISFGFIFMMQIAYYNNPFNPNILFGIFILIWVNDSFAYLIGKNFGKHKLFQRISPKKTIEGFVGGVIFTCLASYATFIYTNTLTPINWLILAVIISCLGTIGDLIESKFKRNAGVKDSGAIMPGHGGLLDRLDSIIFVAPFVYLFLIIS